VLVSRGNVATLLVSRKPFAASDLETVHETAARLGFEVLLAPGAAPGVASLARIAASRSPADLDRAIAGESYDYSPPRDDRPYFFNLLRMSDFEHMFDKVPKGGVVAGNLSATRTLAVLLVLVVAAVLAVIFAPLLASGLPAMAAGPFAAGIAYFGSIGAGFMFVQIGLMQRLSVFLGHPIHAVAVTLFGMIAATGVGSFLSERVPIEARPRIAAWLALATGGAVAVATLALQPLIEATLHHGLLVRCLATLGLVLPVAILLGLFFPLGIRLLRRLGSRGEPWMWGVNGASGVLACVGSVILSIGAGIRTTLFAGALAYALLAVPALLLAGARRP
jgi:hypothetical protein